MEELVAQGRWDAYFKHCHLLDEHVLWPAKKIGIAISEDALDSFAQELEEKEISTVVNIRAKVPESIRPVKVWKREPKVIPKGAVKKVIPVITQKCMSCGEIDISIKHRCKDKKKKPNVKVAEVDAERLVLIEEFNPASNDQVMAYIRHRGLSGGKGSGKRKTSKPSTDKKTLRSLVKLSKDPFFKDVLDYRAIAKVRGTYVVGTRKHLVDGRIHPTFLHNPSTLRLSSVNPNIQNVVADREGSDAIAAGFRKCLVASAGKKLIEIDYSGIEAVQVGWFAKDEDYIRLAKTSVHAYLTAYLAGVPAHLSWSDAKLIPYLKEVKEKHPQLYDMAKRCVHGTNYGLTPYGMHDRFPDIFPNLREAKRVQESYFLLCPKLKEWQQQTRDFAAKHGYLGGGAHPFGYMHYFWDVYRFDSDGNYLGFGEDAKRCIAFFPQSTAAGVLYEACLTMTDPESDYYIGEYDNGRTPIRALIHDSVLAEVPNSKVESFITKARGAMEAPIPQQDGLVVGTEVKVGKSWDKMEKVT